ncbi:MAG: ABC transporter substrate-binding protein [Deltaproteobacteria bacterium]|nr:ABC transporter substrate-binding protein [Deltaproteobacteria bacterium]
MAPRYAGVIGLFVLTVLLSPVVPAPAAERVVARMDWLIGGKHVAFFVAAAKGYYQEAGLAVEIQKGGGSGETAKLVAQGLAQFGFADMITAILGRSQGMMLRSVGVGYGENPVTAISLKDTGIRTPKDLEGKIYGGPPGDVLWVLMPALTRANGVDMGKITYKNVDPAVRNAALMEGRIHFMSGLVASNLPNMQVLTRRRGKELNVLWLKDWGLNTYGHSIFATEETLAKRRPVVGAFVMQTFRAWRYAIDHPAEATAILMKAHPQLDREITELAVGQILEAVQSKEAREHGLGYMDLEKVKLTVSIVNQYFTPKTPVDHRDVFTNEFIKKF